MKKTNEILFLLFFFNMNIEKKEEGRQRATNLS